MAWKPAAKPAPPGAGDARSVEYREERGDVDALVSPVVEVPPLGRQHRRNRRPEPAQVGAALPAEPVQYRPHRLRVAGSRISAATMPLVTH